MKGYVCTRRVSIDEKDVIVRLPVGTEILGLVGEDGGASLEVLIPSDGFGGSDTAPGIDDVDVECLFHWVLPYHTAEVSHETHVGSARIGPDATVWHLFVDADCLE